MPAGGLRLRVEKYLGGMPVPQNAVIANIYALDPKQEKNSVRNVFIPVGPQTDYQSFPLPNGQYLIEVILPSGDILSQEAGVDKSDWTAVDLRAEQSAHEWHSWQNLVGNVASKESYDRLSTQVRPRPVAVWAITEPTRELCSGSPEAMNVWSFLDDVTRA
jgi:hypothetical protein